MPGGWTATRARLALIHYQASCKGQDPNPSEVAELRQRLRAQRAEAYVSDLLTGQPALSGDQLAHLAGILLSGAVGDDDAA